MFAATGSTITAANVSSISGTTLYGATTVSATAPELLLHIHLIPGWLRRLLLLGVRQNGRGNNLQISIFDFFQLLLLQVFC